MNGLVESIPDHPLHLEITGGTNAREVKCPEGNVEVNARESIRDIIIAIGNASLSKQGEPESGYVVVRNNQFAEVSGQSISYFTIQSQTIDGKYRDAQEGLYHSDYVFIRNERGEVDAYHLVEGVLRVESMNKGLLGRFRRGSKFVKTVELVRVSEDIHASDLRCGDKAYSGGRLHFKAQNPEAIADQVVKTTLNSYLHN